MFSTFDKSTFPIIKVTLDGEPESDTDFQLFLDQWLELYDDKKDFIFFFNTENVRSPPLKYCLKMSYFIKELRKKEYQYLQKSILLINSNKVKWLLDLIFLIQPPVAPVYIYHIDNRHEQTSREKLIFVYDLYDFFSLFHPFFLPPLLIH